MMYCYLKKINKNLEIKAIHHYNKMHGISEEILDELKSVKPSLLIILDASANDTSQCKELTKLGWSICIAEHHQSEQTNPYCILVSNQESINVENKGLCGTGVGFKIMQAIDAKLKVDYSKDFISYVWLANVSDSVPFTHPEQYTFAKYGRKNIHKNIQPFIDEYCEEKLDNRNIAWKLTPKLNSLIRLGTLEDKQELFSALCGETNPTKIIDKCKSYHTQQTIQSKKMAEDVEIVSNDKVLIARLNEKTTMTGLVAGKLMSKYNKPVLLGYENDGEISGSLRSPIDFKDVLSDSGLTSFQAGHLRSCGFGYPLSNEQDIITYLNTELAHLQPHIEVLATSSINSIPKGLFSFSKTYEHLWGKGISEPLYCIKDIPVNGLEIQEIGKSKTTVKFKIDKTEVIAFFCTKDFKDKLFIGKDVDMKINIIAQLSENVWNNKKTKQVIINEILNVEVLKNNDETEDDWDFVEDWGW